MRTPAFSTRPDERSSQQEEQNPKRTRLRNRRQLNDHIVVIVIPELFAPVVDSDIVPAVSIAEDCKMLESFGAQSNVVGRCIGLVRRSDSVACGIGVIRRLRS